MKPERGKRGKRKMRNRKVRELDGKSEGGLWSSKLVFSSKEKFKVAKFPNSDWEGSAVFVSLMLPVIGPIEL